MPDYDISNAFARIEDELISSMFRNFSHHRAEETKEGFNWEMWQVRQLKALDEYRRANKKIFTKKFANLNTRIDQFIKQARSDGAAKQEIAMLEAMKKGYKTRRTFRGNARIAADFIKLNDRKMDALINATTHDLERAEHAMLRMANDQYRKIIFDAQVYALSGAGTYEKAVDMAARDFLKAGINCIAYKNGARHTMQDYVSMVLSTTGKRAYLTGEGEMRKQWGESLVIMNKRGNPCPLCAPFVGKVLIDDVWSGGKPDGVHLLMSAAIDKGLYHPRCKDGHTTYFEGISDEGEPYTESERRELTEQYNAEQKSNYAKNQAEKCGRIAKYSLDEGNKKVYAARAEKWRGIAEGSVDKSGGSGIIKLRRLAQQKDFNYRDYDEVIDEKSVDDLKAFVADKLDINHISGIEKLKNGKQAHELLSKVEELSKQHGKRFTSISLRDYGDSKTIAETVGNELRLNVQYLNRPDAFKAILDEWENNGFIPKGSNSSNYVAKHEYFHLLTQDMIDEPHSRIMSEVMRAINDGCEMISENGRYDCHEFVADLLSAKKLTKSQKKLKNNIIKILETR